MFQNIDPKTLPENVFSPHWGPVDAGHRPARLRGDCNTMTASWGGLGVLWNKPMATIYVRPQRYTFQFLEGERPVYPLLLLPQGASSWPTAAR